MTCSGGHVKESEACAMTTTAAPGPMTLDPDLLAREHLPLVHYMVADVLRRVPGHISKDELTSAALCGLAQAVRSFDPTREIKFSTFARGRIQGALLDELRARDWASRSVRALARSYDAVSEELAASLGRTPTNAELTGKLGSDPGEVERLRADLHRAKVLSLDVIVTEDDSVAGLNFATMADGEGDPGEIMANRELHAYVRDAVSLLPERLRRVVVGYFLEERPMLELAEELGVTESRISQIRAEALSLMGEAIGAMLGDKPRLVDNAPAGVALRRRAAYCSAVSTASDYRSRVSIAPLQSAAAAS